MAKPRLLAKADGSGDDGCPSIYVDGDELIVQGPAADLSQLRNVLPGESASRIDVEVVRRALDEYDRGGS
jgi:hypothetical protein